MDASESSDGSCSFLRNFQDTARSWASWFKFDIPNIRTCSVLTPTLPCTTSLFLTLSASLFLLSCQKASRLAIYFGRHFVQTYVTIAPRRIFRIKSVARGEIRTAGSKPGRLATISFSSLLFLYYTSSSQWYKTNEENLCEQFLGKIFVIVTN